MPGTAVHAPYSGYTVLWMPVHAWLSHTCPIRWIYGPVGVQYISGTDVHAPYVGYTALYVPGTCRTRHRISHMVKTRSCGYPVHSWNLLWMAVRTPFGGHMTIWMLVPCPAWLGIPHTMDTWPCGFPVHARHGSGYHKWYIIEKQKVEQNETICVQDISSHIWYILSMIK